MAACAQHGYIPDANVAVFIGGDNAGALRVEGNGGPGRIERDLEHLAAGDRVPDADDFVVPRRGDPLSVGADDHLLGEVVMGHAEALGAGQPVHNPDDVVIGCRGIPFIVGAEGSTLHPIPVLDDMLRAAIALGQPSHAVTSARNEPVAVRAPGQDGVGAARVQRPVIEEVAARLPEADLSVQHGKGQDVAIGREAECAHAIGLLHIDRFHILFIEIIQGQEAVCPANGQHAVADVQVENRAGECKLLDQVPTGCIPDLDRLVGAGGDQVAAIL